MVDRYCRNCGNKLGLNDRFCSNCGHPVHEVAHVPTPEADVPVPPLPQQAGETAVPPQQRPGTGEANIRGNRILVGVLVVIVLFGIFVGTGNGGGGGGANRGGGGSSPTSEEEADSEGSGETFTKENYAELVSDPDAHVGAKVDVTGQLLEAPETQGDEIAFQMWADPENADWNTVVFAEDTGVDLDADDYAHVVGTVSGSMEGENAFGATVTAVEVEADSVETVDPVEAIDPTQQEANVNKTLTDQGFSITVEKIEFAEESTRVYVKIRNDTGAEADFYTFDAKIVQGSTQVDQETPFDYEVEEPQSTISPGVQTEGIVVFGPVDPSQPFSITFEWSSRDYNIVPRPITLKLSP